MEIIRILFYTDLVNISHDQGGWGTTSLSKFIGHKLGSLVNVSIEVRNRHRNEANEQDHAATKLTHDLLAKYDELWVFGYFTRNMPGGGGLPPEPENELTVSEVAELRGWMNQGGVLITGDHAQHDSGDLDYCALAPHDTFFGLGRALGHRIPRAGQLRVWKGPPTNCKDDSHNTNAQGAGDLDDLKLQEDENPQTLDDMPPTHELFRFLDASGQVVRIDKFPDHAHEGQLVIPSSLDSEWPSTSPLPKVVARGRDKRPLSLGIYDLVAAYDGDSVKVGRIVADTSFHHYININLKGIKARTDGLPTPGTDLDKIAEYYGNLAFWLAPKPLRDSIKVGLIARLAGHPDVFESLGSGARVLGRAAIYVLESVFGYTNVGRVFGTPQTGWKGFFDELLYRLLLPEKGEPLFPEADRELALGVFVRLCQQILLPGGISSLDVLGAAPFSLEFLEQELASAVGARELTADALTSYIRQTAPASSGVAPAPVTIEDGESGGET